MTYAIIKRFIAKNGLDNNNNIIVNVANPVNPTDGVNLQSQSAAILAEATRAATAEGTLTTNLGNEVTRATNAEGVLAATLSAVSGVANAAQTASQVSAAIQAVVGAAPSALDTLAKIDAQLSSDESAASALISTVSNKANASALTDEIARATAAEALLKRNWKIVTASMSPYTTAANEGLSIDTSAGPVTIMLPNNPVTWGDINFTDGAGTWATNNVTVLSNDKDVVAVGNNGLLLDISNHAFALLFNGVSWRYCL